MSREPTPRVLVITVSDRAAGGNREDRSGPLLVELFRAAGYDADGPVVVTAGVEPVAEQLRQGIAEDYRIIVTSGGTGISPRDFTPEATREFVTRELIGVAEALRAEGARHTPLAALSRGIVGLADRAGGGLGTLLINLPGSVNGVEESMQALLPLLPHLVPQIYGWEN